MAMRVESSVTSLSWIPSEAVTGLMRLSFASGLSHYDPPPTGQLDDLNQMRDDDAFRFANVLDAWAEFDGNRVAASGQDGGVRMGSTTAQIGPLDATFAGVAMPDLVPPPEIGDVWVRFTQTTGGRTVLGLPRRTGRTRSCACGHRWSGRRCSSPGTLTGSPRSNSQAPARSPHWVYDDTGALTLRAGVADWPQWLGQPLWTAMLWGNEDCPVVVAAGESALERELSTLLMHGARKPKIRLLAAGDVPAAKGDPGESLYLVLDGVRSVTVDGVQLGAVLGERAVLEHSPRAATLTAMTPVKIAEAPAEAPDLAARPRLAQLHHREVTESSASS
jgi:hypothetical protein